MDETRCNGLLARLTTASLVEARALCEELTPQERVRIGEALAWRAEYLARVAAYVGERGTLTGQERPHEAGVKEQNRVGRAVRKVFGYVGGTSDIVF